ncbi:MAG: hypothetical protein ACFFCS_12640 [Candidatus Hodarchaeota archaeon]
MNLTSQYDEKTDSVNLKCPLCGHLQVLNDFKLQFPKDKINTHKGVTTVAFNAECGHTYLFYVDKTFNIRGYHSADFCWSDVAEIGEPVSAEDLLAQIKADFGDKIPRAMKPEDLPDYHEQVETLIDDKMPELEDLPELPDIDAELGELPNLPDLEVDELPDLPEITVEERQEIEEERKEIEKTSLAGSRIQMNDEERANLLKKMKFYKSRIRKTEDLIDELRLPKTDEEKKSEWATRKLERLLLTKKKLRESYNKILEELTG